MNPESKPFRDYSKIQTIAYDFRAGTIEWLFLIHLHLKGDKETFFKTIQLYDKYLSKESITLKAREVELFAAVCLFICYKLEEVDYFDLAFLRTRILGNKFTKDEIISAEITVLKKLSFKVNFISFQSYTDEILIIMGKFNNKIREVNFYVNLITYLIDELIFEYSLERLSKITYITSVYVLFNHGVINKEEFEKCIVCGKVKDIQII